MKKEFQIYIHIPFCVRKCNYCDFLSFPCGVDQITAGRGHEGQNRSAPCGADIIGEDIISRYFACLKEEIRRSDDLQADMAGAEAVSVFFGGGTPSLPDPSYIAEILDAVREKYHLSPEAEISMECNPATLSDSKLESYKKSGVNRLSIGLQSADNKLLSQLGRVHTRELFEAEFIRAREIGFENINVDLIYGIPGQSVESWSKSLDMVLNLPGPISAAGGKRTGPEHISAYSLIIEENTPFWELYHEDEKLRRSGEKPLFLPSEDDEERMLSLLKKRTKEAGMHRYEISNYALDGYESVHNKGYWQRREYLGFGLGAFGQTGCRRFKNTGSLERYLTEDFSKEEEIILSRENEIEETFFLGLRMTRGVDLNEFKRRFGLDADEIYKEQISSFVRQGLMDRKDGRLFLTERGLEISNLVMADFLLSD